MRVVPAIKSSTLLSVAPSHRYYFAAIRAAPKQILFARAASRRATARRCFVHYAATRLLLPTRFIRSSFYCSSRPCRQPATIFCHVFR